MALVANVVDTKLGIEFQDGDKTIRKTYSNLKTSATDQNIYETAGIIASLSEKPVAAVKKVVESELADI